MKKLTINLQNAASYKNIPSRTQFKQWVLLAIGEMRSMTEVTIRIVDKTESASLNQQYRQRQGPTNILSFSYDDEENASPLLGDLVICAPLVEEEAQNQKKSLEAHWAHLVIHGTLHLLGYDHQTEPEALEMETKEIFLLTQLGYSNPY